MLIEFGLFLFILGLAPFVAKTVFQNIGLLSGNAVPMLGSGRSSAPLSISAQCQKERLRISARIPEGLTAPLLKFFDLIVKDLNELESYTSRLTTQEQRDKDRFIRDTIEQLHFVGQNAPKLQRGVPDSQYLSELNQIIDYLNKLSVVTSKASKKTAEHVQVHNGTHMRPLSTESFHTSASNPMTSLAPKTLSPQANGFLHLPIVTHEKPATSMSVAKKKSLAYEAPLTDDDFAEVQNIIDLTDIILQVTFDDTEFNPDKHFALKTLSDYLPETLTTYEKAYGHSPDATKLYREQIKVLYGKLLEIKQHIDERLSKPQLIHGRFLEERVKTD